MMLEYIFELVDLTNNYDGTSEKENRMRDLICYLSEYEDPDVHDLIEHAVFEASEKIRVFGYTKGKNALYHKKSLPYNLAGIKHQTIQNFYTSKVFSNNLLDKHQKEIVDCFQNLEVKRLLVSAPTSFGKTFILREILFLNQSRYNNILLVFPTIALLNENTESIRILLKSLKSSYIIINNVYSGIDLKDKHIFILTPERTLKLLADNLDLQIDFFFFDEIYKIDEDFNVDENITSTKDNTTKTKGQESRAKAFRIALYLLTKTVPECYLAGPYLNLNNMKAGLRNYITNNSIKTIQVYFEPTMRIEIDAWKKKSIQKHPILGVNPINIYSKGNLTTQEKISALIKYIEKKDLGQAIFYCSTPKHSMDYVRGVISSLSDTITKSINQDFIDHLKNRYGVKLNNGENSAQHWSLVCALENGYGIHHGKFPKYVQNEILKMFNNHDFYYLFCTSTIIEGVNTNAQNVVIINNSVGSHTMSAFTIKNIKGRAGRYYHHYSGRVFYTDRKQREIEKENQLKLNFSTYDSRVLNDVDIDNTDILDLSDSNQIIKKQREEKFNRKLLPDSVFIKNRLFARDTQEKYLRLLLERKVFIKFIPLIGNTSNIKLFLKNRMINTILETMEESGIIEANKASMYHAVVSNYSINRTQGIIKHHIDTTQKKKNVSDITSEIDRAYINAFEQIRNIVEYEVPRLLCLFEALFSRAASLNGYDVSDFNMSAIIRFFELGVTTEFGLSLVEYGFPIDTIKEIEKKFPVLAELTTIQAIDFLRNNAKTVISIIDSFELTLFRAAIKSIEE